MYWTSCEMFIRPQIFRSIRRGFTLIETAMATVIVGVGIFGTMTLFAACSNQNNESGQTTVAILLASNVQEAMANVPFNDPVWGRATYGAETGETLATWNDLDDFDGATLNPPIDSLRTQLAEMSQYQQVISVVPVYPTQLSSNTSDASPAIPKTTYTGAARVRVRIMYRPTTSDIWQEVYRCSWIRLDR